MIKWIREAYLKRENKRLQYKIGKLQAQNSTSKKMLELSRRQRGCKDCPLQKDFTKLMKVDSERIFTPLAPFLVKTEHAPLDLKE